MIGFGPPEDRFLYWRKGDYVQNFGDFLAELFLAELFLPEAAGDETVLLVGSVIVDWFIRQCMHRRPGKRVVFWGCGVRDEAPVTLHAACRFAALRGPLSRDTLGLPPETVLGDPGLLLPLLHRPAMLARYRGRSLCVPHIADPASDTALLAATRAECLLRPAIPNTLAALRDTVDAIASAGFVLAGSLHAAIVACAYGVPFAFLDSGYVDLPFKWRDFAASVGIAPAFAREVAGGRAIWEEAIRPALRLPPLAPLLAAAPLPVRPELMRRAELADGATGSTSAPAGRI